MQSSDLLAVSSILVYLRQIIKERVSTVVCAATYIFQSESLCSFKKLIGKVWDLPRESNMKEKLFSRGSRQEMLMGRICCNSNPHRQILKL